MLDSAKCTCLGLADAADSKLTSICCLCSGPLTGAYTSPTRANKLQQHLQQPQPSSQAPDQGAKVLDRSRQRLFALLDDL